MDLQQPSPAPLALKPSACSSGVVSSMMARMAAASAWSPTSSGSSSLRQCGGRPRSADASHVHAQVFWQRARGPGGLCRPGERRMWPWRRPPGALLPGTYILAPRHAMPRTRRARAGPRCEGPAAAACWEAPEAPPPPPHRCPPTFEPFGRSVGMHGEGPGRRHHASGREALLVPLLSRVSEWPCWRPGAHSQSQLASQHQMRH